MWRRLILLVIAVAVLLLAGTEIYLRLSYPANNTRELYRSSPNPRLLYQLRPLGSITFDGVVNRIPPTRINISAYGLRDRDYAIPKGKAFRIAVLGDSFTFGWGVNLEDTFVKKLENILSQAEKREFEVINLGVPGYNTRQEIEFFKEKGLPLDPDLVLVGFAGNDFEPRRDLSRASRLVPFFNHLYLLRMIHLFYLRVQAEKAMSHPDRGSLPEVVSALEELKSIGAQRGFASALVLFIDGRKETRQLTDLCPQMGMRILDLTRFWRAELTIPGDFHPNPEAHSIYAEEIYRFLKQNGLLPPANQGAAGGKN